MSKKNIYLTLAIIGTVLPYFFFTRFYFLHGMDWELLGKNIFNPGAIGFSMDLLVSVIAFWIWAYHDSRKNNVKNWWWIFPANLMIGLSCALPLYLYLREREAK